MYRILFINWRDIRNPEAGGAEVHLHEISRRIAAKGHDVTLLTSGFEGAAAEESLDGLKIVRRGGKFTFNFHVPGAVRSLTKNAGFDVVVDDINKIPFYTPLYVRSPILALAHHLFAHTIFLETILPFALYVYLGEALIPPVYGRTKFVVVSESTRRDFVKRGIPQKNIKVVYNAVDHSMYTPDFSAKAEQPLVGYVGRIKRYKRIDHLLMALKIVAGSVPDVRLKIAGSGDYLSSLVSLARRLGISDRIEFMGFVTEQGKIDMLRQAHVVVNPSSKEGWGVTVIESNACGTPVIASDVPGLRDAVVDGKTGYLVPYGDTMAFAGRIIEVLNNETLRKKLSDEAVAWAGRFNWDDSADAILDVIADLAGKR
jgi:glycosyltransferase involved in cell wall biosynthesis